MVPVSFLVDTGAYRTVLHANMLDALDLETTESSDQYGGIGGRAETLSIETRMKLVRSDGGSLFANGPFPIIDCAELAEGIDR